MTITYTLALDLNGKEDLLLFTQLQVPMHSCVCTTSMQSCLYIVTITITLV